MTAFDTFWSAYPRRVGKGAAVKVFERLKVDDRLLGNMLTAIDQQKRTDQWQQVQFVPHPATWLRQSRWLDEVQTLIVHEEPSCPHLPVCDAPGRWACVRKSQIEEYRKSLVDNANA